MAQDPVFMVGIEAFGESSIDIGTRCWVPTSAFFQSMYRINQTIYSALQDAGITIPFPQRDVNLRQGG